MNESIHLLVTRELHVAAGHTQSQQDACFWLEICCRYKKSQSENSTHSPCFLVSQKWASVVLNLEKKGSPRNNEIEVPTSFQAAL